MQVYECLSNFKLNFGISTIHLKFLSQRINQFEVFNISIKLGGTLPRLQVGGTANHILKKTFSAVIVRIRNALIFKEILRFDK